MPRVRELLRARLGSRGARRWYPGGVFGALYGLTGVWFLWQGEASVVVKLPATILLLLVPAVFVPLPPLLWGASRLSCHLALFAYTGLVCLLFPFIGTDTAWMFMYVACAGAAVFARFVDTAVWIAAAAAIQLGVITAAGQFADEWFIVALTLSISAMLRGITQLSRIIGELRAAQDEVARLAVAEERARFSRDLHDVLGHSLTVVTVKSELAGRLIERDPARARAEVADIERLGRSALADLRASIAGYRAMNLDTELAAARAALAAAEVEAIVPVSGEAAAPDLRELFAWAVRESVTNVIRHARAASCSIELSTDAVAIADDGVGVASSVAPGDDAEGRLAPRPPSGHGLAGLAERAAAAGAVLTLAPREPHGTVVTVKALTR
jgi:two-component system, NarL family, sensor histidine kinase DesK